MKVKFKQSLGILLCSNANYEFEINLKVTNIDGNECVLYEPICALRFVDKGFLSSMSLPDSEYCNLAKTFTYLGSSVMIQNDFFVTMAGLKHIFSSLIGLRQIEKKIVLNREQSKFLNWLLKFDIDSYVLKSSPISNTCKFCQTVIKKQQPSFFENNSQLRSV